MCERPGIHMCARAGGDVLMHMSPTHKMVLRHPETPVELSVSLFDSFGKFICSKGSSSIGYRVDWCKNHRLQSNQFVGRPVEEEEKEKEKKMEKMVRAISVYNC